MNEKTLDKWIELLAQLEKEVEKANAPKASASSTKGVLHEDSSSTT